MLFVISLLGIHNLLGTYSSTRFHLKHEYKDAERCRECSSFNTCLIRNSHKTYRNMFDLKTYEDKDKSISLRKYVLYLILTKPALPSFYLGKMISKSINYIIQFWNFTGNYKVKKTKYIDPSK